MMAADRPYGEFYDFYSFSPEYFGYHHVCTLLLVVFGYSLISFNMGGNFYN
jgi:hypothetical protein